MPFTLLALLFCKCCSRMEFLALKRSVAEATCRFESYRVPKVLCIGGGTGRRRGLKIPFQLTEYGFDSRSVQIKPIANYLWTLIQFMMKQTKLC